MSAAKQLLVVAAWCLLLASCGGGDSATSPLSTTPLGPTAPAVASSFGLSGTISEVTSAGLVRLAGAQVATSGQNATTNGQGFYSLTGLDAGPLSVTVSKAGYKSETRTARFPGTALQGFFDVEIVRESDLHTLSGVISELTASGLVVPVQGVKVTEISCNAASLGCVYNVMQTVVTDASGAYRIAGLYAGKNNIVWVDKEGFEDPFPPHYPEASEGGQAVTLNADMRFDIQIVRR